MGIITKLIELNHQKKMDDTREELDRYTKILTLATAQPDLFKPETVDWAIDNIANLAEGRKSGSKGGGGKDNPFKVLLKGTITGLKQLNPSPDAPKSVGAPPSPMTRSPEERSQFRAQRETEYAKGIGEEEGARETAKGEADVKTDQALFEQQARQRKETLDQKLKAIDTAPFSSEQKQQLVQQAWSEFVTLGKAPMKPSSAVEKRAQLVKDFQELGHSPEEAERLVAQSETAPKPKPEAKPPGELGVREAARNIIDNPDKYTPGQVDEAKKTLAHLDTTAATSVARLGKSRTDAATANAPTMGNPASVRSAALFELISGDKPSFGLGRSADRDAYNKQRNALLAELGPEKVAQMRASYKAGSAELSQLMKATGLLDSVESAFQLDIKNALDASRDVGRTASRRFNSWTQFAKADLTDSPELAKFRVATQTATNQYSRIMVSAGRGSVTTDSARTHAEELLNTAMATGAFEAALHQMDIEAQNMTKGLNAATGRAEQRMTGAPAPQTALPKPDKLGQKLNKMQGQQYLDAAGGDKEKARAAAKKDGWGL